MGRLNEMEVRIEENNKNGDILEELDDKLTGMKIEIGKLVSTEIKKSQENHKMLFISTDRHQADIAKMKRDLGK